MSHRYRYSYPDECFHYQGAISSRQAISSRHAVITPSGDGTREYHVFDTWVQSYLGMHTAPCVGTVETSVLAEIIFAEWRNA